MTLPGGITEVDSFIQVENDFKVEGSFNTVYVYSYNNLSTFQAFSFGLMDKSDDTGGKIAVTEKSVYYDLTDEENKLQGQIAKQQSIETSLIIAYKTAMEKGYDVYLDYEFKGFIVYLYLLNQKNLKIGSIINKVIDKEGNVFDASNPSLLANSLNHISVGDTIYYLDNEEEKAYLIEENINFDNLNMFYCYRKYEINYETALPRFNISKTNTGGPSGGFLQTLQIYCNITKTDLTMGKKIVGTGTIEINGNVGAIGGIGQKIVTAIRNDCEIFLCGQADYKEAKEVYDKTLGHNKMVLIEIKNDTDVSGFLYAINELEALRNE